MFCTLVLVLTVVLLETGSPTATLLRDSRGGESTRDPDESLSRLRS